VFSDISNVAIYDAWLEGRGGAGWNVTCVSRRHRDTNVPVYNYWPLCRFALCTVWWPTCRWQRLFSSDLHRHRRSLTSMRSVFHAQEHPIDRLRSSAKYRKTARCETIITGEVRSHPRQKSRYYRFPLFAWSRLYSQLSNRTVE